MVSVESVDGTAEPQAEEEAGAWEEEEAGDGEAEPIMYGAHIDYV